MRKFLPYIGVIILATVFFNPIIIHAQSLSEGVGSAISSVVSKAAGGLGEFVLTFTGVKSGLSLILFFITQILSAITGIAGLFLNQVILETVVKMSANVQTMDGINIAWRVIRDLMNIAFIFLLVYSAG